MERKRAGVPEIAAVLFSVAFFAVAGGLLQHIFRDPDEEARQQYLADLAAMRSAPPPAVTFRTGDSEIVIRDSSQVSSFLSLLIEPQRVDPHHSHAVDGLTFELAGDDQRYLLARDSKMPDEFWLEMFAAGVTVRLKQLRTTELEPWLARHKVALPPATPPDGVIRK